MNKENIIIRNPKISDLNQTPIYINKLSKEKTYVILQGEIKSKDSERKRLKNNIKAILENKSVVKFIFHKNELIGICSIELRSGAKEHVGGFGLSIDKKYRGQGLGSLLMDEVLIESKKKLKKMKYIYLEVFAENIAAIKLYEKKGFVKCGLFPNGLKRKGKFVDEVMMFKKV
jgi:ribosomal protein S18 acetylase RimI-like enzyme